jgi:hypothetical protein
MTTFHEKYLKYKTKYLVLKKALNTQSGGSINLFDVSELTDTPVFINSNTQSGGRVKLEKSSIFINSDENDILNISRLSDTPTFDILNGGNSSSKSSSSSESSRSSRSSRSSSSSESSNNMISESSGGGSKKVKKNRRKTFNLIEDNNIKKVISDSSTDDSSDTELSDSTESLMSSLKDSDSEL